MNSRRPLLWVVCCGIVLSLPVLLAGFPYPAHDSRVHEVWYSSFALQLWSGELYPRWLQNLDGGLGGPTFYFYPPAPYYITSLLHPLLPGASHAWQALGISAALALILSGVTAFAWLNQIAGARSAGIAAVLYMAMPYHFAVDLHTRGAFGELWSFVWMPLILFCVLGIAQGRRMALVGLAVSYALLIATHMPTTLIFSLIPPAYALWSAAPASRVRALVWTAGAMTLGIGLSAIYLMPAMLDQSSVSMSAMHSGDYFYAKSFFIPGLLSGDFTLARDAFETTLFWVALTTTGVGLCAWFVARRSSDRPLRNAATFWMIVAAIALVMMFPVSNPVYRLIPSLQLIQFAWRFNAVLAIAVACLLALGLSARQTPRSTGVAIASVMGLVLVGQWALFAVVPLRYTSFGGGVRLLTGPPAQWTTENWNTVEYRPRWAQRDIRVALKQLRSGGRDIPKARLVSDSGAAVVSEWNPRRINVQIDSRTPSMVEVGQYYYPGWTATIDGTTAARVTPSTTYGLINVSVPSGKHALALRLEKTHAERVGERVSTICVIGLIALIIALSVSRVDPPTRSEAAQRPVPADYTASTSTARASAPSK